MTVAGREWRPADTAPDRIEVETKIDDEHGCRNEQTLTKSGNLWFHPDMSAYVYYTPTHWRPMTAEDVIRKEREQQRRDRAEYERLASKYGWAR